MKKFVIECRNLPILYRKKGALCNFNRRHPEMRALTILGEHTTSTDTTQYLYCLFKRHGSPCSLRGKVELHKNYTALQLQKISASYLEAGLLGDRPLWSGVGAIVYLESFQFTHGVSDEDFIAIMQGLEKDAYCRFCPRDGFPIGRSRAEVVYNLLLSRTPEGRLKDAVLEMADIATYNKIKFLSILLEKML